MYWCVSRGRRDFANIATSMTIEEGNSFIEKKFIGTFRGVSIFFRKSYFMYGTVFAYPYIRSHPFRALATPPRDRPPFRKLCNFSGFRYEQKKVRYERGPNDRPGLEEKKNIERGVPGTRAPRPTDGSVRVTSRGRVTAGARPNVFRFETYRLWNPPTRSAASAPWCPGTWAGTARRDPSRSWSERFASAAIAASLSGGTRNRKKNKRKNRLFVRSHKRELPSRCTVQANSFVLSRPNRPKLAFRLSGRVVGRGERGRNGIGEIRAEDTTRTARGETEISPRDI